MRTIFQTILLAATLALGPAAALAAETIKVYKDAS